MLWRYLLELFSRFFDQSIGLPASPNFTARTDTFGARIRGMSGVNPVAVVRSPPDSFFPGSRQTICEAALRYVEYRSARPGNLSAGPTTRAK